mgnify:CR=1 FL=1
MHESTPENFAFSLKAPQRVTHFAKLRNCGDTLNYLFGVIQGLEQKLGPLLFQLPPAFKRDEGVLGAFLDELPGRNSGGLRISARLMVCRRGFRESPRPQRRPLHRGKLKITTPAVETATLVTCACAVRITNRPDVARWAEFLRAHKSKWTDAFVYFKHEERGEGPRLAAELIRLLNDAG